MRRCAELVIASSCCLALLACSRAAPPEHEPSLDLEAAGAASPAPALSGRDASYAASIDAWPPPILPMPMAPPPPSSDPLPPLDLVGIDRDDDDADVEDEADEADEEEVRPVCTPRRAGRDWPVLGGDAKATSSTGALPGLAESLSLTLDWSAPVAYPATIVVDDRVISRGVRAQGGRSTLEVRSWALADGAQTCTFADDAASSLVGIGQLAAYGAGRLYVPVRNGVAAVDPDTGERSWVSRPLLAAAPFVAGDDVVLTGIDLDSDLPAIALVRGEDGTTLWTQPVSDVRCSGVVASVDAARGRVAVRLLCTAPEASLLAVHDLADGTRLWSRSYESPPWITVSSASTPVFDSPSVLQYNAAVGPLLFEGEAGRALLGVATPEHDLLVLDLETGEEVWAAPDLAAGRPEAYRAWATYSGQAALAGERVLVVSNAVPVELGSETAKTTCGEAAFGCEPGQALGAVVVALDRETGATLWQRQLPALATAALTVVGELAVVGVVDEIFLLSVADGAVLARLPGRDLFAHPWPDDGGPAGLFVGRTAVAEGHLLVHALSEILALAPAP